MHTREVMSWTLPDKSNSWNIGESDFDPRSHSSTDKGLLAAVNRLRL